MSARARLLSLTPGGGPFSYTQFRAVLIVVAIIVVVFYCTFLYSFTGLLYKPNFKREVLSTHWDRDYIVLTEGCRILDLAPFDFDLVPYFTKLEKKEINCDPSGLGELVKATKFELYVDESVLKKLALKNVECCYTPFVRGTAPLSRTGIYSRKIGFLFNYDVKRCTVFLNNTVINHQFVYVKCYDPKTNVIYHQDYFTFAVPDEKNEDDSEVMKKNQTTPAAPNQDDREYYYDTAESQVLRPFSVFIIGFDGMSRLNFERQMPRTLSFLREHGGVSFSGYNKVGYNTFPNLIPALTGMNVSEISKTCYPSNKSVLDDCRFIWKAFKGRGYFTAYGEDAPLVSTFFYLKPGFRLKPVDYYLQPYFIEAELNLKTKGFVKHTSIYCVGSKENSARFESAVRNFASRFKNQPTFGLFWFNGMSHDFLNFPRTYDRRFYKMFSSLQAEGAFDSTIILALSDHGIRWGRFRQTFQGFLEERLPLATIVLPPSFKERFPRATANLEMNSRRLTTPFDVYETLWDIIDLGRLPDRTIVDMNAIRPRGMSLFYPIPETRTCHSSGIPVEYCACDERKPMDKNDPVKYFFAQQIVFYQNEMLAPVPQCAQLTLSHIDAVWENVPHAGNDSAINFMPLHRDFVVRLTTTPGNGIFEARIRFKKPHLVHLVGTISRLNMYKNDSICVEDELLKLYCYCLQTSHSSSEINLPQAHEAPLRANDLITRRVMSPTDQESKMLPPADNPIIKKNRKALFRQTEERQPIVKEIESFISHKKRNDLDLQ